MELKLENNPFGFFSQGLGMPFMRANTMNESNSDVNELFSTLFGNMMAPDEGCLIFEFSHGGVQPEHLFGKILCKVL